MSKPSDGQEKTLGRNRWCRKADCRARASRMPNDAILHHAFHLYRPRRKAEISREITRCGSTHPDRYSDSHRRQSSL